MPSHTQLKPWAELNGGVGGERNAFSSLDYPCRGELTLKEGRAMVQWPAQLSAESAQDLVEWLTIVQRQIKRMAER